MSTETLEETLKETERLIERAKAHFSDEDLDLIKQACAFAETIYAQVDHPLGMRYIEFATNVALQLVDLHFDSLTIASSILLPPPPLVDKVLPKLKESFKDKGGLIKIVEEILYLCRFELNPWPMKREQNDYNERKVREELMHSMFLLTIDESGSSDQEQQFAEFFQPKEKQTENLIRMFFDLVTDVRALIIWLVDRLFFIKLLKPLSPEKRELLQYKLFANSGMSVYAPIADRLGIWQLKSDLEDMSFRLLEPEKYEEIKNLLSSKKKVREDYIVHKVIPELEGHLKEFDIEAHISGRPKHIYAIHQKMELKQLCFEHLNDLLGVRIIVDTVEECYFVLEIILSLWRPVKEFYQGESWKDWIANPKENQYQSLHTTISFDLKTVEIQIRTHGMHETAEYGIAAQHWLYKNSKTYRKGRTPRVTKLKDRNWSKKLGELRKSLPMERQSSELKHETLIKDRIFVITPKGHVIDLRIGATPLDFAYRIHSDLGHKYSGAKVNGRLVHLDYKLNTGDVVELLTSRQNKNPSRDWLNQKKDEDGKSHYVYAQTPQARSKIRHQLNKQNR